MKSGATFEFKLNPQYKDHVIEVECGRDGTVYAAAVYDVVDDLWVGCMERIQQSEYWMEKIREAVAEYDWEDFEQEKKYGA